MMSMNNIVSQAPDHRVRQCVIVMRCRFSSLLLLWLQCIWSGYSLSVVRCLAAFKLVSWEFFSLDLFAVCPTSVCLSILQQARNRENPPNWALPTMAKQIMKSSDVASTTSILVVSKTPFTLGPQLKERMMKISTDDTIRLIESITHETQNDGWWKNLGDHFTRSYCIKG